MSNQEKQKTDAPVDASQQKGDVIFLRADTYQELASRTLITKPDFEITDDQVMIAWNAIGLAGETGEIMEQIKHGIFHQKGLNVQHLKKELGDCLWYISAICTKLNLTLSEVMEANIEKLKKRYPNGYNPVDSELRADGEPLSPQ